MTNIVFVPESRRYIKGKFEISDFFFGYNLATDFFVQNLIRKDICTIIG